MAFTVPAEGSRPRVVVRLLPTCSPAMLQLRKLAPTSNAVRSITVPAQSAAEPLTAAGASGTAAEVAPTTAPTPLYNTSILQVRRQCPRSAMKITAHNYSLYCLSNTMHVWGTKCRFASFVDA